MKGPNLSAWAISHPALIRYLIGVLLLSGAYAYFTLGQMENPEFTIKTMVIKLYWPGATAREMEQQVTDKLEQKLQETPWLDFIRSYSKPGESVLLINLKESTPARIVPDIWYQARKKAADVHDELPAGVRGPFFNDEYGDVFGSIYAFTADGFSYAELKHYVDFARQELLRLSNINKVEIIGAQDEKIYIEMSDKKLAALGINPLPIFSLLAAQNAMEAAGVVVTPENRVPLRLDGTFDSLDSLRAIGIRGGNNRIFSLSDIAEIGRGYENPPVFKMRYMGQDAIGLAVSMAEGGNVLQLGADLRRAIDQLRAELPVGIDIHQVTDQPRVVEAAVNEFMKSFLEAVVIVLGVTFFSLGWRAGVVVALCIPLVLAMTFLGMKLFDMNLDRISLGALILALGLLVDDAIIVMEMIDRKLELGWDRLKAATFAYTSTALPMLTGTLVTVAGFLPVGLAKSNGGEYVFGLFAVVAIALIASWLVAVLFTPYLGYALLPDKHDRSADGIDPQPSLALRQSLLWKWRQRYEAWVIRWEETVNDGLLRLVEWCLRHYWRVLALTVAAFILAGVGFRFVPQQFFPSSSRPELLVDLWLPEGSSFAATETEVERLETRLMQDPDVASVVSYVGGGSPFFYLAMEPQHPNINFAQMVVMTQDEAARERVLKRMNGWFENDFPQVRGRAARLENGPPVGYPVQFRVVGPDSQRLRSIAAEVVETMRANPHTRDINTDWRETIPSVRLRVDQDKARALGINPQDLARNLNAILTGMPITQYREADRTIDVVLRARQDEPGSLGGLKDLQIYTENNRFVPLGQIAYIEKAFEEGIVWRRNRFPAITVRADVPDGVQPLDVTAEIDRALQPLRARLPAGYRIDIGGAQEANAIAQKSIFAVLPLMLATILTLLMIQLQSFQRTLVVLLTAPLGIIGVTLSLLVFQQPFGFVAMLGVIALSGIIIRNAVILLDQIQQDLQAGLLPWDAVVGSTVRRFRPIMLTALTAILALIPLTASTFWGPMAIAIMGGLLIATILDRLALPALYVAWFKVRPPISSLP